MDSVAKQRAMRYYTLIALLGNTRQTKDRMATNIAYTSFIDTGEVSGEFVAAVGSKDIIQATLNKVRASFGQLNHYYVVERGTAGYPSHLASVDNSPSFLFLQGDIELLARPVVSIVGTRHPSDLGKRRAEKLAALLSQRQIVVASGLAQGIDAAAHRGALLAQGKTIAVLGTPLNQVYPKDHGDLQEQIARDGLLVSQFPPSMPVARYNFPQRNATMSGISLATVVIEAGETSGALIQADFAIKQNRIVFIPQSALDNKNLRWPQKFLGRSTSVHKFSTIEEVEAVLAEALSTYQLPPSATPAHVVP